MFDYKLALITGVDIPVPELQLAIHQPTIKEISMVGETDFFMGIQLLCIKKELCVQDESLLADTTNFQIFMTMMHDQQMADKKASVLQVFSLLFPQSQVIFSPRSIILKNEEIDIIIDEGNFEILQEILAQQFCLHGSGQEQFNPEGEKATEIARKLMNARKRIAEIKAKEGEGSVFTQYVSALVVGLGSLNMVDAINLTMYQLYDLVERYSLYLNWDIDIRSRMAGAKADKPVENWMKPIHKK